MTASHEYFEDYEIGDRFTTSGRTIEVADILTFAGLTGDHYPLHVDEEYARKTQFNGRIAHGPLTFSMAVGLVALSGTYGTSVEALLGCDDLRALRPVRPGDTVHVNVEIIDAQASSKPEFGKISLAYNVVNQRGESVMTFTWKVLVRRNAKSEES